MAGRDIVDLITQRKIEARARGSGIESVGLEVRRLVNHEVNVLVPVGTFFVSRRASAQNMVTTSEQTIALRGNGWVSASVSAACANRPRDVPESEDSFRIERAPGQKELQKLMSVLGKANTGSAVRQAAVWIVTDDADFDDLGVLIQSVGLSFGGKRVINEYEAALAMKICDEAGIAITKKAIWRDRQRIMEGLADENLKAWLQRRAKK